MKILKLTIAFSLACIFSACTPDYGEMLKGRDLKLEVSSSEIIADGEETVTFKVLQQGKDVTADCEIILQNTGTAIKGNTFSTSVPDCYAFVAKGFDKTTSPVSVTAKGTGDITLATDCASIPADGTSKVTFSVKRGEEDITADSEIYQITADGSTVKVDEKTFSSENTGAHKFFAKSGSSVSDMNVISVMLPDSNKDSYSSFAQKTMLLQFTAQGCGPCAKMKQAVALLEEEEYEDGIVVACHTALMPDTMYPDFWKSLWDPYHYNMQGIPVMTINLIPETSMGTIGEASQTAEKIKSEVSRVMSESPATSAISAIVYGYGDEIRAHASIKIADDGEYKASAWLLEDGIMGYQQTMQGDINHHDVLRGKSHDDVLGTDLTPGKETVQDIEFSLKVSDLVTGDVNNAHVVIFVTKKGSDGSYAVNNIIDCPYNGAVGFEYAK